MESVRTTVALTSRRIGNRLRWPITVSSTRRVSTESLDLRRFFLWLVTLGTAGGGLLNLYSVTNPDIPATRVRLLQRMFPLATQDLSRTLTLLIGFALVVSAINIWKRKRRAFHLVLLLSLLSTIFHLTKGLDYEAAVISLLLFLFLLFSRKHFNVKSGPLNLRQAAMRTAVGALLVLGYGVIGFWLLDQREFGFNFHWADAVKQTVLIVLLAPNQQLTPLTPYARWFAGSVHVLTFAFVVYAGLAFFSPIIYRLRTVPTDRPKAAEILNSYGQSSLDLFKLWPDKSYYFNEAGNSCVAYRVANNYAVALADPVGPENYVEQTSREFLEFCRANDWGVTFYQTLPNYLSIYHELGLKHLKIGDDAIIDLTRFELASKRRKRLRRNVKRFESNGFQIVRYEPPVSDEVVRKARFISDDWLTLPGHRERQFSLGMFVDAYVRETPIDMLVDPEGQAIAFVNQIKSYRRGEATIDLMRHLRDAPNGAMDYLFTKLFLACKDEGFQRFNFGMAPLDGFRETEQPTLEERGVHYFVRHLNSMFSYSGLRHYKAKFADTWEPRYLIYQNILALPKIALALTRISATR